MNRNDMIVGLLMCIHSAQYEGKLAFMTFVWMSAGMFFLFYGMFAFLRKQ